MIRAFALFLILLFAPVALAQVPPPPPEEDLPKPMPGEGKKVPGKKQKQIIEPERQGVKPPLPVIPPVPEPTLPDEP